MYIERKGLDNYGDFLSCENVNRDKIKTIPDTGELYDMSMHIILYMFYIALYFGYIAARNYTFNHDYDYRLI